MRKILLSIFCLVFLASEVIAGGIVTNTNQSAAYVRMLARDATLGIDGVYYNPAGLTLLGTGLHISINNQFIFQNRYITSNNSYLNSGDYKGKVSAPVFPSIYAAFNYSRFSISFGFNPVGGGGGATFNSGLPSFEYGISDLVPSLQAAGQPVTGYKTDIYFEGKSVYWGAQLGVSYKVNDILSVFLGGRYVMVSTTYKGHIKDNKIIIGGDLEMSASDFFQLAKQQASTLVQAFSAYPAAVPMPDSVAVASGLPSGTTFGEAAAFYTNYANQAGVESVLLQDQEADVTQTGHGITPIIGANINLLDKLLNIGIKYEFQTNMDVTNNTKKDIRVGVNSDGSLITEFPDGKTKPNDMPALLSVGAALNLPKLTLSAGYHQYFDKKAKYGKVNNTGAFIDNNTLISKNNNEIALGLEYNVSPFFLISAGYLRANTGVKQDFQSDLSPELSSNTGAIGGAVKFTKLLTLNVGVLYTKYIDSDKNFIHYIGQNPAAPMPIKETYGKDNTIVAIGLDINLSK